MPENGSSQSSQKPSWLTTLPGLLTALGAFVTVVTGFFTLIKPLLWSPPEIKFSVAPAEVRQGDRVVLDWTTTNARQVTILPNIGNVGLSGRRSVQPSTTTTYTLIAKRFFATVTAEYEVRVVPSTKPPSEAPPQPIPDPRPQASQTRTISFSNYNGSLLLTGNEFISQGIQLMKAAPARNVCQNENVQVAILPAGSYKSQYSFLTTAAPSNLKHCNNVPLAIHFVDPVRKIVLHFGGAQVAYELRAYRKNGSLIRSNTARASSYAYADYEISLTSDVANIAWVEFGYETALTMIRDVEFQ